MWGDNNTVVEEHEDDSLHAPDHFWGSIKSNFKHWFFFLTLSAVALQVILVLYCIFYTRLRKFAQKRQRYDSLIGLDKASEYESSQDLFEQSQTINDEEKESLLYFKEDSGEHAVQQSKWRRFIAWLKVESAHSWKERVLEYLRRLFLLLHSLTVLGLGASLVYLISGLTMTDYWPLTPVLFLSATIALVSYLLLWLVMAQWKPQGLTSTSKKGFGRLRAYASCLRNMISRHKLSFIIFFVLIVCISMFSCFCVSSYCSANQPETDHTTRFTRWVAKVFHADYVYNCPDSGVCHVYLLLAPDPSSQMQVVYHTTGKPKTAQVQYGLSKHHLNYTAEVHVNHLHRILDTERYVNTVLLKNLTSNTTYYFRCIFDGADKDSHVYKFRTLPPGTNSSEPLMFAVGGDLGGNETTKITTREAARHNPWFVVFGGDLAYDNAWWGCHCRWDRLFSIFQSNLKTPEGHIIPILASVGNHEVGGEFRQDSKKVPFIDYFPYAVDADNPVYQYMHDSESRKRMLYHSHRLGTLFTFVVLDSGLVLPHNGSQTEFLERELQRDAKFKFVVYHIPLYPSRRSFLSSQSAVGRVYWESLFEKYQTTLIFENHDHVYKRTYPMINGKACTVNITCRANEGLVFMGDGAWGIHPQTVNNGEYYLAKAAHDINYFGLATLNGTNVSVVAMRPDGSEFDSFTVPSKTWQYFS